MYREELTSTYNRLITLSVEELGKEPFALSGLAENIPKEKKEEVIRVIMAKKFGNVATNPEYFEKIEWNDGQYGTRFIPLVHIWLKFKQIRTIFPIQTNRVTLRQEDYDKEDGNRWIEVSDDYQKTTISQICELDEHFDTLVIERCNVDDWVEGTGTWPRAKGDDWRETMQVGDIVEVKDEQEKDYESLIRYVYPDSKRCIVHYIGWNIKWDEALDVNSSRIVKRYTNRVGPHRPRKKPTLEPSPYYASQPMQRNAPDFDVNAQSQEEIDLQRAIAASLGQI